MVVAGCQQNKSCSKVFNFLERLDDNVVVLNANVLASLYMLLN